MVKKVDTALVSLHGDDVGAVSWLNEPGYALFEYEPAFLKKAWIFFRFTWGLMRLQVGLSFLFPHSVERALRLPGLLADCLPDKFGNALAKGDRFFC